jgi:hypothetical protein
MNDSTPVPESQPDPLARYRWSARVLVVLAVDAKSPALAEQRQQVHELGGGPTERYLVLVAPPPGSTEQALASDSPGNNPRVTSAAEIERLYEQAWAA